MRLTQLVAREPQGAAAYAICAVASLHFARASGLDAVAQHSAAKPFYEPAYMALAAAAQTRGQYAESEAVAAVHLVLYALLSGGAMEWPPMLDIAYEWLSQTALLTEENPKLVLMNMTSAGRFAAKATMVSARAFMPCTSDVLTSSITPPVVRHFLQYYACPAAKVPLLLSPSSRRWRWLLGALVGVGGAVRPHARVSHGLPGRHHARHCGNRGARILESPRASTRSAQCKGARSPRGYY